MAGVLVRCPECGPIEILTQDIELVSFPGRPMDRNNTYYTFTCPACGAYVRRPADRITANVLTSAGVSMHAPRHPVFFERVVRPRGTPAGPAFTPDDVLDLHLLLEREDWFSELLAADRDA